MKRIVTAKRVVAVLALVAAFLVVCCAMLLRERDAKRGDSRPGSNALEQIGAEWGRGIDDMLLVKIEEALKRAPQTAEMRRRVIENISQQVLKELQSEESRKRQEGFFKALMQTSVFEEALRKTKSLPRVLVEERSVRK